jgi:hypothetical protein
MFDHQFITIIRILMCLKPCYGFRDAQIVCIPGSVFTPMDLDQCSHAIPCIPPFPEPGTILETRLIRYSI